MCSADASHDFYLGNLAVITTRLHWPALLYFIGLIDMHLA